MHLHNYIAFYHLNRKPMVDSTIVIDFASYCCMHNISFVANRTSSGINKKNINNIISHLIQDLYNNINRLMNLYYRIQYENIKTKLLSIYSE